MPDAGCDVTIDNAPNTTTVTGEATYGGIAVDGTGELIIVTGSNLNVGGN